ncbi:MAG: hypothetical protein IT364_13545 [Candidatus Hydrogenedentes bacterium]|nr:hypothetical protein [Candidatus Hydrogenedentota bacterium]
MLTAKVLAAFVLLAGILPKPAESPATQARVVCEYKLPNNVPSLDNSDDAARLTNATQYIPLPDTPFIEHVRGKMTSEEEARVAPLLNRSPEVSGTWEGLTCSARQGDVTWIGTTKGLFWLAPGDAQPSRHEAYGVDGPLATSITALAADLRGVLWVGTPIGLSRRDPDGKWTHLQGKQGLPVEEITCLTVDSNDYLWIGSTRGAILYAPYLEGRQWFYRAGRRYLPNDHVQSIHVEPGGFPVYFKTAGGIGRIDGVEMTLRKRADAIEDRLNKFHRRLGLVAAATLDDAENPTSSYIIDDDNDGLWTSYNVVAMSLAYAATGEERYKQSAREGMHAMVMLQNASGTPGLVARSVLPAEEGLKKREEAKDKERRDMREQWQPTADGKMYWKSDTSSDEIDGHFFALFAYWEHIARHDSAESALIQKQARDIMTYIVKNGYYLIDWDGEPTTWGQWAPEILNDDPRRYGENGLGALEILSFLKTTYHITGDAFFKQEFDRLICEHGYLGNILLQKKIFPDEQNHSDNQLAACAYYPWLQLETDPNVRHALQQSSRRSYKTMSRDGSSFFSFVFATIDPDFVDIADGVNTLREVPTDRRMWGMLNSHRADVTIARDPNRHGEPILTEVLPADERNWTKWNIDPYVPDGGGNIVQRVAGTPLSPHNVRGFGDSREGDGRNEDDGGSYLLAYWMGRYHGFIGE